MNRFVKKATAMLLTGLMVISLLSGCSSLQLAQRDIVDAVSIDYSADGYTVCVAAFNIIGDPQGKSYKIYRETGDTLGDTFSALMSNTLSSLMFENNTVIFLGSDAYKYRYFEIIEYLAHNYRGDMDTQVIGVTTEAETVMEKIISQQGSFSQLIVNLTDQKLQHRACANGLYQCAPDANGQIKNAFLPVVQLCDYAQPLDEQASQTELSLSEVAVFNQNGWVENLNGELMEGVLLLLGRTLRIPITIEKDGLLLEASLLEPNIRLFRDENEPNTILVRCTAEFVLPNSASGLSDQEIMQAKKDNERYLSALLAETTYQCRTVYNIDLLNLDHYTYLLSEKPQGEFPKLMFSVKIR